MNQEGERCDDEQPDAEESEKIWGHIQRESIDRNRDAKWLKDLHSEVNVTKQESIDTNKDAKWLKDLQSEVNLTQQEKIDVTNESLKKILGRIPN